MEIEFSKYELLPYSSLSAKASLKPRVGALLRLHFPVEGVGYADLHPWEELGDPSLDSQLRTLVEWQKQGLITEKYQNWENQANSQLLRTLFFARTDALARSEKRSLFAEIPIPASHYLISDPLTFSFKTLEEKLIENYRYFKIKLGRNITSEISWMHSLFQFTSAMAATLGLSGERLPSFRLDFNRSLSEEQWSSWQEVLFPYSDFIDFYEDPLPYDYKAWTGWRKKKIILGLDQGAHETIDQSIDSSQPLAIDYLVLKPARDNPYLLFQKSYRANPGLIFTSYMDHPLGQMSAAYAAGVFLVTYPRRVEHAGLQTHLLFEKNEFSESIVIAGPRTLPPGGMGLGFDEQLARVDWKMLQ